MIIVGTIMKIGDLLLLFFQYQQSLKIYHFQAKRYAAHKASDKLYGSFTEHLDKFFEVYQGRVGRVPKITKGMVPLKSLTDKEMIGYTKKVVGLLEKEKKSIKYGELINILEEIIADMQQFLYLLTFK